MQARQIHFSDCVTDSGGKAESSSGAMPAGFFLAGAFFAGVGFFGAALRSRFGLVLTGFLLAISHYFIGILASTANDESFR